ncbi:MFS transporter [Neorhizobium galegae bv. officinalis]|uniref:MFS transporter n=1 Tax=Neorhizobium galegae bv. officinalis TaxID=323656 RepID=A0A0T7G2L6_NEOGA|nr:MFS transporter [Neorhizobium galegae]CDZ41442.1 MFS transporter [Neorhizobium galegae bv. officinalis]CDZ53441.1 MFS transporter [Neorhizobium galegae bv. officinalis]
MERNYSYRRLLQVPRLLPLILAATLSRLAGCMFVLTLILFAMVRFSSPAMAGWLTFAAFVPGLIASPIAGVLLDRAGPTTAVRIDMIASSILIAAIILTDLAGFSSRPLLFLLVMLFSLTGPLGAAGTRTLLPRLVPAQALDLAYALDTLSYAVAAIFGPSLAGAVGAWLGPQAAMTMIAGAYAAAAICLPRCQFLPVIAPMRTSFVCQTIEGIKMVARQPTLRTLAVSYSLYQLTWGALYVVVPVVIGDNSAKNTITIGTLWTAAGIAGGLGALAAGQMRTMGRERQVMAAGMIVTAIAAWPVAAECGHVGLTIGLVLAALLSGPIDVALLTLRQRRTDPLHLARVMSISIGLNTAGFPLGSVIAGMFVAESPSASFVFASVASAAAAAATAFIPPEPASMA